MNRQRKRQPSSEDVFGIGYPADHCLKLMKRYGLRFLKNAVVISGSRILGQNDMVVEWFISDGTVLTFEHGPGPTGKGAKCYRVTQIRKENSDGEGPGVAVP